MATFKDLRTRWQKAKDNGKMGYKKVQGYTMGISLLTVKFDIAAFPGFGKGMGPDMTSLNDLLAKKDVKPTDLAKHKESIAKYKKNIGEVVTQYKKDVENAGKEVDKVKPPTKTTANTKAVEEMDTVLKGTKLFLKEMTETLVAIENELKNVK